MKIQIAIAALAAALLAGCAGMDRSNVPGTPARTAGEVVDDAAIVTQANAKLAADPELSAIKINVDSMQGAVRLKGEVKTLVLRRKAETLVREIKGVKSVDNQLIITG